VRTGKRQGEARGVRLREKANAARRSREDLAHVRVIAVGDNQPATRDNRHQLSERPLHRSQITENIGVIELDIVEDHRVGQVVDELAALVEERRVVFVALDDEELPT
jgi:hypothetical protein